jgi:peptide subunit release factor RF-3
MGTAQTLFVVDCVVDGDVTGSYITGSCTTGNDVTGSREPEMKGRSFPAFFPELL